jgi:predicted SAM-dependent methyltransferase
MLSASTERVLFLGDFVPNRSYRIGPNLLRELTGHDLRVVNLEGAMAEKGAAGILKAGPHLALQEVHLDPWVGLLDVAVLANNHAMDFGYEGLERTKEICRTRNIATIGAGPDREQAHKPIDIGNLRVLAVGENEFGGARADRPGIASVEDEELLLAHIEEGRRQGKWVVVFSHGGSEIVPIPAPYLRKRYRRWVDHGASLVVGCHPHVVQGCERWNEGAIFYSLGNFAFPFDAFNNHSEACRSIALSVDVRDRSIRVLHIENREDVIEIVNAPEVTQQFELACEVLASRDYEAVHGEIATKLFPLWYQRLGIRDRNDAALLLHYFRCDAHRHLIQDALEGIVGETKSVPTQTFHLVSDPGNPELMRIRRGDEKLEQQDSKFSGDLDRFGELMQMTKPERERIRHILSKCRSFLEIGTGFSTLYFSQYVPDIVSVETRTRWFLDVQEMLHTHGVTNVRLNLFPPESCAYDSSGREAWNHRDTREGSDYGSAREFRGYLEGVRSLLSSRDFDVVLVDGNCRKEIVEMLLSMRYGGVILLHDVVPERAYLNDPILSLPDLKVLSRVDSLVELAAFPYKVQVGTRLEMPGWFTTDVDTLDIASERDWARLCAPEGVRVVLAEHVLEHLHVEDTRKFLAVAHRYLCEGGRIRIAVPDASHPSRFYHDLCRPGGSDPGSEDHKFFYSAANVSQFFDPAQYELRLLEWWDEEGFHRADWHDELTEGEIDRSSSHYRGRLTESEELRRELFESTPEPMRGEYAKHGITYTSLIFDLVKKPVRIALHVPNQPPQVVRETDWLGSTPVFYNEKTGATGHCVNDVIDFGNVELDPDGLAGYLDFGYSVFGRTPIKGVRFLEHSSQLLRHQDGRFEVRRLDDPALGMLGRRSNESDVLAMIEERVQRWERRVEGRLVVPTSGGFDSRLLTNMVRDKSRIDAFTYGISPRQEESSEVVYARRLSELLGTRFVHVPLGRFHEFLEDWDALYGASVHAHGMYHLEFFAKIASTGRLRPPMLSGIIGDVWAGLTIPPVDHPGNLVGFGYTHGVRVDPLAAAGLAVVTSSREEYFERKRGHLADPAFRVVEAMRHKMMLLNYLYRVPRYYGLDPWSPFLDIEVATAMLNIAPERRQNRVWQRDYFARLGLDVENHGLPCDRTNTLDMQGLDTIPVTGLDRDLLGDIFDKKWIDTINSGLRGATGDAEERLRCYFAYVVASPIERLVRRVLRHARGGR